MSRAYGVQIISPTGSDSIGKQIVDLVNSQVPKGNAGTENSSPVDLMKVYTPTERASTVTSNRESDSATGFDYSSQSQDRKSIPDIAKKEKLNSADEAGSREEIQ